MCGEGGKATFVRGNGCVFVCVCVTYASEYIILFGVPVTC